MNDAEYIERAKKTTFYQKKLADVNTQMWCNIPFTTKQDLRDADEFDLLGIDMKDLATYHETSGTSGKPSPSWISHRDTLQEAQLLMDSDLNLTENDLILNRFPFAIAIPAFILYWTAKEVKAGFISADQWNAAAPLSRAIEIIQKTKPTILAIGSNEAIRLYHVAKAMGVTFPTQNLRALIVAGELVSPARRKYIEKLFGVPVYMLFGSTETGSLSMSCNEGHFHLTHPKVKFEAVDEKRQPLGMNKKGACVLSAGREGMPLLRYYNEDIIELKESSVCSCGNTQPVLIHYGREIDCIHINNQTFNFYDIQEAVYSLAEGAPFQWKVQQIDQHDLKFIFQYVDEINIANVEKELSDVFGTTVKVELAELFAIDDFIKKPLNGKSSYIERIITKEAVQV